MPHYGLLSAMQTSARVVKHPAMTAVAEFNCGTPTVARPRNNVPGAGRFPALCRVCAGWASSPDRSRAPHALNVKSMRLCAILSILIKAVVQPGVREVISWAVGWPAWRIDFPMRLHNGPLRINFSDSLAEIANELIERLKLLLSWLVMVEITDQADSESYVIQVVAMNMASINLSPPARAHLDLPVARGGPVSNDKLVGQAVRHLAHVGVIIFEGLGIALPGSAVVNHNVTPAGLLDWCLVDLLAQRL